MELNPVFSLELRRCWFQHVEHYLFSRFPHNMCLFHSPQTRQIISCFYFFYLLLFLFSLELKETLALLATGLPWEWKQVYSLTVFLRSVFSLLVLTHSCVYTQLFGSIFGFTRYTDSCLHSFASVLTSSLSLSLFFRSPSLLFRVPDLCISLPASSLLLLHSFWFSLRLFPILLLLFWCVSRSVIQRISGGGVDASESHLSPWHWRAQSQREGWAFSYTQTRFLLFLVKSVHTCKYSQKSISSVQLGCRGHQQHSFLERLQNQRIS